MKKIFDIIFEFHDKINGLVVISYLLLLYIFGKSDKVITFVVNIILNLKLDVPIRTKGVYVSIFLMFGTLFLIEILVAIIALCRYFIKNRGEI
ncbi:hypothetical protein [Treponema pedis]|uniref:Uncharacterized protein n=1 Tax=Treponema pedis TaxID=409322 RepID=A0A7S7AXN8_9SPIR|nr:hypothetical protein [Treponema pedis]QOW61969.1 hypothetical protein IFE08_06430 [Treponema pedis]